MPFDIRAEDGIFWVRLHGTFTNADLIALAGAAAEVERGLLVTPHRLIDFGPVETVQINYQGMREFVRERMKSRFPNAFKSALVASDVIHFGFARMYQTLIEHPQIRLAIFPTTNDALQWITAPGLEVPDIEWAPGPPSEPEPLATN